MGRRIGGYANLPSDVHRIGQGTRADNHGLNHFVRCICGFETQGTTEETAYEWWKHALTPRLFGCSLPPYRPKDQKEPGLSRPE